jgi:galactokinase
LTPRDRAVELFQERFREEPEFVIRAPGRVNLIGEHTDYNDGFVLPMAIDRATWLAAGRRGDRTVHLSSVGHDDAMFSLDHLDRGGAGWAEYIKGVSWVIGSGAQIGWNGALATDIPIGAGLSSSAAIEIAALAACNALAEDAWDPVGAAINAQRVENDWIGVNSGIMDQLIIATAQQNHVTLIDCRTLEMDPTRMPDDLAVVILDTGTRRELVGSAYGDRRRSCERAASAAGVSALRDLSQTDLERLSTLLDDETFRRARHVISENARTIEAAQALADHDIERFGALVRASHESLRTDFEVSSDALDLMVGIATQADGCIGARMTGAGFGGCAVAFVHGASADRFASHVLETYATLGTDRGRAYLTGAAPAAGVVHR